VEKLLIFSQKNKNQNTGRRRTAAAATGQWKMAVVRQDARARATRRTPDAQMRAHTRRTDSPPRCPAAGEKKQKKRRNSDAMTTWPGRRKPVVSPARAPPTARPVKRPTSTRACVRPPRPSGYARTRTGRTSLFTRRVDNRSTRYNNISKTYGVRQQ